MSIDVRLFALIRERIGAELLTLTLRPGTTIRDLRQRIAGEHPAVNDILARCAFAIGGVVASDSDVIPNGVEVAVLPPVSGGES